MLIINLVQMKLMGCLIRSDNMLTPALRKKAADDRQLYGADSDGSHRAVSDLLHGHRLFQNTEDLFRNGIQMVFEFDNLTGGQLRIYLTTKDGIYLQWYWNSIIVLVASTVCSLGLSSICGYAIGAYDFKGKNFCLC